MGLGNIKTEAGKRNGNGRYTTRANAKIAARKRRRINDKRTSNEQE